jgi:hypothetical protein
MRHSLVIEVARVVTTVQLAPSRLGELLSIRF